MVRTAILLSSVNFRLALSLGSHPVGSASQRFSHDLGKRSRANPSFCFSPSCLRGTALEKVLPFLTDHISPIRKNKRPETDERFVNRRPPELQQAWSRECDRLALR